ncbi:flagellar biosynthesis protein FlgL [Fertoebacter nigrum]|uniref:Flagellar biosynthesis protein FlgL n=1 Tax=Fertoeibacter niger TaxID=2656921 RepID=A0A8X8GZA3_9RHOB|nr:flagellin [Fertoeibacter niger]NUB44593.1 flagellar biosynthesis protein FlgL [Fertoeibacter niger]
MAMVSLGDMAQSFLLRRQNVALKVDQQRLSSELALGRVSDAAQHLRADLTGLGAMEITLARLAGYATITAEVAGRAAAMQGVLEHIGHLTLDHRAALLSAGSAGTAATVSATARESRAQLEAVIAVVNTQYAGQTLFAGVQGDGPALADAETLLAALETATAGAATSTDLEAAVTAWFASPGGFVATLYQGGEAQGPLSVAQGEKLALGVTARDPAIADTLKALALGALVDRGSFAGQPAARAQLLQRAGESLFGSEAARVGLAARIGLAEARLEQARLRNSAEASALDVARSTMLAVDPYETAVRLEATTTQLETLYSITARITRLSLVDYLR